MEIDLKVYGTEEHPDISNNYSNIGGVYRSKGDYDIALKYYEKALDIAISFLGEGHPNTRAIAENMLYVCKKTENRECMERCMSIVGEEKSDEERIIDWIAERLASGASVEEVAGELTEAGLSEEDARGLVEAIKQGLEEQ